jgi:hypothetical protein
MSSPSVAISRLGQVAIRRRTSRARSPSTGIRSGFACCSSATQLAFSTAAGTLMLSEPEGGPRSSPDPSCTTSSRPSRGARGARGTRVAFLHAPQCIATMPDHALWMAFLNDSEGNVVGLMSEVRS